MLGPMNTKDFTSFLKSTKSLLPVSRKLNKMKREPGYYWVKTFDGNVLDHGWLIGECGYSEKDQEHFWYLPGTTAIFTDNEWDEINETRLTSPAESQGENIK